MTRRNMMALGVLVCLLGWGVSGAAVAGKRKLGPKPAAPAKASAFGYIPRPKMWADPPVSRRFGALDTAPSSWDWRSYSGVTPIKNQNPYGACWSFAAMGAIESQGLILESSTWDFSEYNLIACNPFGTTCNSGGNDYYSIVHLTIAGTVLEANDLYSQCPTVTCNAGKPRVLYPVDWYTLANNTAEIKDAVYHYGPVYTSIYASDPNFQSLAAGAVYYYTGTQATNHAVLIVGYDDNKVHAGGVGAWLIKNSWGTWWSSSGYGWVAYGSARIGEGASSFVSYRRQNADELMQYYDEKGCNGYIGYGDHDAWGMVRITPANTGWLNRVAFWTTDVNTNYRVRVYDNFSGTTLSTLLASANGTAVKKGYYTVSISPPIKVTASNEVYLAVGFTVPNSTYPVPLDMYSTVHETNKGYLSDSGATFSGYDGHDIGIRGHFLKDADYDLVTDSLETGACWKPADPDSDDDGLCDGNVNVVNGTTTVCVAGEDFDADGTQDASEPSPCDSDSDDDLMPDYFEVVTGAACGLNPRSNDANGDADGDCITNRNEYLGSTNPCVADPPGCVVDTDGDGLTDGQEASLGTNPNSWDTDSDNLPDKYEYDNSTGHGAQNLSPTGAGDGAADFDGDGILNAHEYWNGSDPWTDEPAGYIECGYWAESDGDSFITGNDRDTLLSASIGNPTNYVGVFPATGETQDLDGDGWFTGNDVDLITSMMVGAATSFVQSRPASLVAVDTCTATLQAGHTCHVSVAVLNSLEPTAGRQAGVAVAFTVDPSSTGTATILGGEGAGDLGGRYDLSRSSWSAPAGLSRAVVRVNSAGTVKISARVPRCGTEMGVGRSSPEIKLERFATITVP